MAALHTNQAFDWRRLLISICDFIVNIADVMHRFILGLKILHILHVLIIACSKKTWALKACDKNWNEYMDTKRKQNLAKESNESKNCR